ncbi:hypothetical protein [Leptospira santarosai]|uniref:hypothetical protein n=1 Tax=Leptospira santarosai TaxID=28183 RepID=UPI004038D4C8
MFIRTRLKTLKEIGLSYDNFTETVRVPTNYFSLAIPLFWTHFIVLDSCGESSCLFSSFEMCSKESFLKISIFITM